MAYTRCEYALRRATVSVFFVNRARVRDLLLSAKHLFVAATCLPLPGRATRVLEVAFPHIHPTMFSIVAIMLEIDRSPTTPRTTTIISRFNIFSIY